jgi:hypothetical protein
MSAAYPYLAELKEVLADPKKKALDMLTESRIKRKGSRYTTNSGLTQWREVSSVFGVIITREDNPNYLEVKPRQRPRKNMNMCVKCGIEVLGLRPKAKGNTYSEACKITIARLKEKCKMNGIKTTKLDKVGLLAALQKV